MDNFLLQRYLPAFGKNTFVHWNKKKASKAIIFIHGFSGSTSATFGGFNTMALIRKEYADYDIFFYGYDSIKVQIQVSANKFWNFLEALHDNLEKLITESGATIVRDRPYSKIVIVGHSLGAVVTRYGLLAGYKSKAKWLNKISLAFFAPAHKGARKSIKLYYSLPGLLKYLGPIADFFIVTIDDVLEGSAYITNLEKEYQSLIKKGITSFTIAEKVIWAELDRIVYNLDFASDKPAEIFDKASHTSVCKPSAKFLKPIEAISKIL